MDEFGPRLRLEREGDTLIIRSENSVGDRLAFGISVIVVIMLDCAWILAIPASEFWGAVALGAIFIPLLVAGTLPKVATTVFDLRSQEVVQNKGARLWAGIIGISSVHSFQQIAGVGLVLYHAGGESGECLGVSLKNRQYILFSDAFSGMTDSEEKLIDAICVATGLQKLDRHR